ncbi:hypothetical protein PAMA_014809 [Pampus argenteus]
MKTFSVAVVVAVVLTFICIQESSAVPVTEVQEMEMMIDGIPVTAEAQMDLLRAHVKKQHPPLASIKHFQSQHHYPGWSAAQVLTRPSSVLLRLLSSAVQGGMASSHGGMHAIVLLSAWLDHTSQL